MNGAVSKSIREKGLVYKLNFGVELPRIKGVLLPVTKDHSLAQALLEEDIRVQNIGGTFAVEVSCPRIADIWVEDIRNIEIAELTCMNLFPTSSICACQVLPLDCKRGRIHAGLRLLTIARLLMKKGI